MEKVLTQIRDLEKFYQNFQVKIQRMRNNLEKTASQLALFSRHDFKNKVLLLNEFSRDFDQFKADSEPLEEETRVFDARVPYMRGIAAHYNNQPELVKHFLTEVTVYQQPEQGEDVISFKRRVANAYYYLGLTEANFGHDDDAIAYFENANLLDPQRRDFLTKIVYAEAYVTNGNFEKAVFFLHEVEDALAEMETKQGSLASYHLRLRSRAALIRASIEIMRNDGKWGDAVRLLLEPVHAADTKYYYVTATLAQAYAALNDYNTASKLFREAHEAIIASNDLIKVTETRSRILLLMVAGMSARHGLPESERMSNDYLDEADMLRGSLPKIGEKTCTVFSPLNKLS